MTLALVFVGLAVAIAIAHQWLAWRKVKRLIEIERLYARFLAGEG